MQTRMRIVQEKDVHGIKAMADLKTRCDILDSSGSDTASNAPNTISLMTHAPPTSAGHSFSNLGNIHRSVET